MMSEFKKYTRKGVSEMRPYVKGEDMSGVSVSPEDHPSLDMGMIARNPGNHADQWYVSRKYFEENLQPVDQDMKTLEELHKATLEWSHERGILTNGKLPTQGLKLISEVGELCDNIAKGKCIKDDIGDCLVVLTNLANLFGTDLAECWAHAYEDIKDRTGFLNEHGNFIKSTEPGYEQLKLEFTSPVPVIKEVIVDFNSIEMEEELIAIMDNGGKCNLGPRRGWSQTELLLGFTEAGAKKILGDQNGK